MVSHTQTEGPEQFCGHLSVQYHTEILASQLNETAPKQEEI